MKASRYRPIAIAFGVFVIAALLFFILQGRAGTPATMLTASDLLAVHQAMTKDGVSGFLPGNHSRLGERLRRKRFTSVSILPSMVSGTHSIHVPVVRCSTSLLLLKDSGTSTWTVRRDIQIGRRYWKSKIGTTDEP
jgi:hypothetical protein